MAGTGRVEALWVYPVKSMRGVALARADVDERGLRGDRAWAVVDAEGKPVTARDEPRLREVGTHLVGGALTLDVPGETPGLSPDEAGPGLSRWLGRTVRLQRSDTGGFADVAPVHVVSLGSIEAGPEVPHDDSCDVDPRANLVLQLDGPGAVERSWLGSEVGIGGARLRVVKHPKHCLGTYADVVAAGAVTVGDQVDVSG
jgi:uncharacterized protein YcbX